MRLVSCLLLPLLFLLFGGVSAHAQSGDWTVSEAKGVVTVSDARGQRPAAPGMVLVAGATIRTEARASAVLVRGREFVTMRQNAQLRIPAPQRERGIIQIIQDFGSALFNIDKQPNPHFGVETPYLAAVVKGTTFVITVSGEGASLQVTEGAVEASTVDGGARELIRPGAVAMIAAGDPLRMVIEGEGRRVLDSPARGTGGPAAPAPAALQPARSTERGGARLMEAVVSTPRDLGEVSGGFAGGEVVVLAAVVVADNTGRGNAAPIGISRGRADDGVVCAGATCAPGGGGNGNGGNSGNGGGNGNGGNGDGNPGNGGGNGNGGNGDGNPGNGGGNGNGGNGDGNPGNGGGNGNGGNGGGNPGNGGGNGNGGNGGGNPGNGGGNGNGGNGDGNPGNGGGNGNGPRARIAGSLERDVQLALRPTTASAPF